MKKVLFCLFFLSVLVTEASFAQNIIYSDAHKGENERDVNFEILGKVGPNYLVFKNVSWRSMIQVFDNKMKEVSNERLKFMPDRVLNADFVTYPNHFLMLFQHQRNAILYCKAVKMDANGEKIGEVITLDTLRIGVRSAEGVYSTAYSEDKKRILVYKMLEKNNNLNLVTKLYDENLNLIDSTRATFPYNDRKEVYSAFQVANDGTIFYIREIKSGARENISRLEMVTHAPNTAGFKTTEIGLQDKFIDEVSIKIDNLNNNFIINSLYYPEKRSSSIAGLFTALVNKQTGEVKSQLNSFSDSLRSKMTGANQFRFAFDNLFIKNIFVKRDGSFVLVAEEYSTQNIGGYNRWNRWDYLYNNPYSAYDYNYMYSPYYRYNRFNSFNNMATTRYYYDKILVLNVGTGLNLEWSNTVLKSQSDDNNDSFLSFGTMNAGSEIHFLFIEKEKNAQIISNHSVSPYGNMFRYPTIKSREAGYQFMPRLSKQVGARQVLMPCVYRGNISFARIDF
ncbi:MAG: hypothetical protein EOO06_12810 [Chitinophagaceae bacterium]|nr:MAG: hypothetical protein EOO06_12810 [Chitinophagaceae bacterium]